MVSPFKLNERATIQQRPIARDSLYGRKVGNAGEWATVAERVWCNVQDVLPSRAESSNNGARVGTRQARFRVRKQILITADMRVVLHGRGERVMQVVAGPALLDDRMHVECMLEEVGNG
ncbi:phage head completion protein [Massilia sp. DD77]|uniref:phage head completion protein n=1 Tax=Massilia sp. DD77 TaxID=3109349 RepID=UPI003FA5F1BC